MVYVTAEVEKILGDALALPDGDRRRVAEALLQSVGPETAEEIETAWVEEARRRAGALERGEIESRDGDAVVAELEAKYLGAQAS